MSERRTFTLGDDAVSYLEKVPKELNSKFVSSLIVFLQYLLLIVVEDPWQLIH